MLSGTTWDDDVEGEEGKEEEEDCISRYFHRETKKNKETELEYGLWKQMGKWESFRKVGMVEVQRERVLPLGECKD